MIILNSQIWSATVKEAKEKAANSPAWLRAIEKADKQIRRTRYWSFDAAKGELKLMSATSREIYSITAAGHTCPATVSGNKVCYHRAAHRLMTRYAERLDALSVERETKSAQSWSASSGAEVATKTTITVQPARLAEVERAVLVRRSPQGYEHVGGIMI